MTLRPARPEVRDWGTQLPTENRRAPGKTMDPMSDPAPRIPQRHWRASNQSRALTGAGYSNLSALAVVPASEVRKHLGMRPQARRIVDEALKDTGRTLV
jgi:hypothetical protein